MTSTPHRPTNHGDVDFSWMDCAIFTDTPLEKSDVIALLAGWLNGRVSGNRVMLPRSQLIILRNDDYSNRRVAFPDGFLFFAYLIEVYFVPEASLAERVSVVSRALEALWDAGMPAVAACDYETELPKQGGVDGSAPWPPTSGRSSGATPEE